MDLLAKSGKLLRYHVAKTHEVQYCKEKKKKRSSCI